jgi:tetratricopeptide (TPR) repeat protein
LLAAGPSDPNVAGVRSTLGVALEEAGRLEEAKEQYLRAAASQVEILGENNPRLAGTYANLAQLLKEQKQYDQSLTYSQKALRLVLASLGPQHPRIADIRINMGWALFEQGKTALAEDEFESATTISQSAGKNGQEALIQALTGRGTCRAALQGADAGIADLERAVQLAQDAKLKEDLAQPLFSLAKLVDSASLARQAKLIAAETEQGTLQVEIEAWLGTHHAR